MTSLVSLIFTIMLFAGGDPPTPLPPLPPVWLPTDPITHTVSLINADFELEQVGWQTWNADTGKPANAATLDYAVAPSFSSEHNPAVVRTGQSSWHIGRMYDPWQAGLKQAVQVPPGATVRFCSYGRLYASNRDFGHEASWSALDGRMRVGLAPDGAVDWNAAEIVWSAPANPHDDWQRICAETVAGATGQITLFTSTDYRGFAAKHLEAWWDDAELTVSGGERAAAANALLAWPGLTVTQPISVWLLIPASTTVLTPTAFSVYPAQVYVSAHGGMTLTLSEQVGPWPLGATVPIAATPWPVVSATPLPSPTQAATLTPTATATAVPTNAAPPSPPAPTAVSPSRATSRLPKATATPGDMTVMAEAQPTLPTGVIGLVVLLGGGLFGVVILARRR